MKVAHLWRSARLFGRSRGGGGNMDAAMSEEHSGSDLSGRVVTDGPRDAFRKVKLVFSACAKTTGVLL